MIRAPLEPRTLILPSRSAPLFAVAGILVVVGLGLAPFEFRFGSGPTAPVNFNPLEFSTKQASDLVANVLLYFPLGILILAALPRGLQGVTAISVTIVVSALLSTGVEFLQMYAPSRVPSWIDGISNTLGAAMGAVVGFIGKRLLPRLAEAAALEWKAQPEVLAAKAYVAVLIVAASMPFCMKLEAKHCAKRLVTAHWSLFQHAEREDLGRSSRQSDGTVTQPATAQAANLSPASAPQWERWVYLKRWSRWVAEGLSFVPLGWLVCIALSRRLGFGSVPAATLTLWMGGSLAIGLSVIQIPMVTRTLDVTDVAFRLVGLWLGLAVAWHRLPVRADSNRELRPALGPAGGAGILKASLAATGVYVVYHSLIPLSFDRSLDDAWLAFRSLAFRPFAAYAAAPYTTALDDAAEKVAMYAVLASLCLVHSPRWQVLGSYGRWCTGGLLGAVISAGLEIPQAFMSVRVVSLTDPFLAAAGGVLGAVCWEQASAFVAFAQRLPESVPAGVPVVPKTLSEPIPAPSQLPSASAGSVSAPFMPETILVPDVDTILGTLSDELPDSPAEPSPQSRPTPTEPSRGNEVAWMDEP